MIGTKTIDSGKEIDWGKTSKDYARFRPGPPDSFFRKLSALDVGLKGQKVLDLGTGTGVIAHQFAKQGCHVTACDISENQIKMAKELAQTDNLNIQYFVSASEEINLPEQSFDLITANQCFLYFDKSKMIPLIQKLLSPTGVLVTSHFSWMPLLDKTAFATEQLILKHNPSWSAHSYRGEIPPIQPGLEKDFKLKGFFYYDQQIPFSRESWRGRIRACRGIGAALNQIEVEKFDLEHDQLLKEIADEHFTILHRIDAHIMVSIN